MEIQIRNRNLLDPENLVLILIVVFTFGLMLHGDTLVKIPRYYTIEITDNDGSRRWVYVKEEEKLAGEDHELWQPPCYSEEEEILKKLGSSTEANMVNVMFPPMYDVIHAEDNIKDPVEPMYDINLFKELMEENQNING